MRDSAKRSRVAFVDWLRLLAALQMIVGHTVDAVLVEPARANDAFAVWTQIRGLTAPAFLLASGISFALATRLEDDDAYAALRARPGARRRRVIRSGWLVVLGTLLHAFDAPWVIDVLQCVGASLLALDLLVTLVPRPSTLVAIVGVLAVGVLAIAAPLDDAVHASHHTGVLRFALGWIDDDGGSLFPLFPWAFYVFTGVVVGRVAIREGARTEGKAIVRRLATLAVAALAVAGVWNLLDPPLAATWSAHPVVLLGRSGLVVGLAAALALVGLRAELPDWGTTLAGETLALYVVHLLVLYAEGVGPGRVWARSLSPSASFALAAMLVIGSGAIAIVWARVWPPIEQRWMPWLRGPLPSQATPAKNEA